MSQDSFLPVQTDGVPAREGELFSLLLRLHALDAGEVAANSGPHIQAAFLDIVRQSNPTLSEWLHTPNQRRPYTVSLLNGLHPSSSAPLADVDMAASHGKIPVKAGQIFWLRITLLDATIFSSFFQYLLLKAQTLTIRIGAVQFSIGRLITAPEPGNTSSSWAAYSSFSQLRSVQSAGKHYTFEFRTPTAFSKGQKMWGKQLFLFPTPGMVFENLARQWDSFAPVSARLASADLTPKSIELWCDEQMVVTHYALSTSYLSASRFGQIGFHGQITYEVKGNPVAPIATWLPSLARFAFFSGIGYKTTMGMGQARWVSRVNGEPAVRGEEPKMVEGQPNT
ncbi:CRISPR-associated endoribonuclease Cas6 [Dictyobacter arantiisoli]|uniref:CRISPR-associated endoribonuclease Cas6 n=1 Tax=Dictyobacter arantiisoli TaxID=2014874 RepID=A0A5A5TF60_9CHLR|nr:CRISPR-associated endoribonuclease Cas6 [Dictyobacter arantiisoli]GCF10211.1 CRISPR-associated endoribonuclease Cas6 [Dictyobacter arantiisoli]